MFLYTMVAVGVMVGGYYLDEIDPDKNTFEHGINIAAGILWPIGLGALAMVALNDRASEVFDAIKNRGKEGE